LNADDRDGYLEENILLDGSGVVIGDGDLLHVA